MFILIVGSGRVGSAMAKRALAAGHEVSVMDSDPLSHERLDKGYDFDAAIRAGYKAVLCSPHFFLLLERPGKLDDYALASRLSYFLWSSMPDEELLQLAEKGELHRKDALHLQVERRDAVDDRAIWHHHLAFMPVVF